LSVSVTSPAVPLLGRLVLGAFPSTLNGSRALTVCQQWDGLRAQYVVLVQADTPFQLEQWFSSAAWRPAFSANSPLKTDPRYGNISTAFGLVSTGTAASLDSARSLDAACAAAD
jgi:hypothetical protein